MPRKPSATPGDKPRKPRAPKAARNPMNGYRLYRREDIEALLVRIQKQATGKGRR